MLARVSAIKIFPITDESFRTAGGEVEGVGFNNQSDGENLT